MIEKIIHEEDLIAVVIRKNYRKDGISFFTPEEFSQQLAFMSHPGKYIIPAHLHKKIRRNIYYTREVLFIRKGKAKVDLYTDEKKYIKSVILKTGDVMLLARGGHGMTMLEKTDMIEVKQGPYSGSDDKIRF